MAIEYLGLSNINGPLVALEGVQDAFFDEIVEFVVDGNIRKMGRIVELNEDKGYIYRSSGAWHFVCGKRRDKRNVSDPHGRIG